VASGITFSGFNNIDFNLVLNSIMAQASQPLTALQTRQSTLQSQITTFGTLTSRITSLESAASALGDPDSVNAFAGTSSDSTAIGVAVGAGAVAGDYDVVVNELARAQVTASASSAPDANTTVVASGGTLTIGGVAVAVAGDVTLQQLADTINDTEGIGVNAAVIRTGAASYRLVLTGKASGEDNAFTISNGLSGGLGVTFTDTNGDNVSGDSPEDNAVQATNASLLVNNIAVTGSSNVFEDVIPGVTITALKKDPATTVRVGVATDSTSLEAKVEEFITAYNDIVKFAGEQNAAAVEGKAGAIGRDPLLRQLRSRLRTELLGEHGSGDVKRLSEVGIEFTSTGTLKLNTAAFRAAIADGPATVQELFAGTGGVFGGVGTLLSEYTASTGLISSVQERLTKQIGSLDTQIANMQARLAVQRQALQTEFIAADVAMSRLKSQSSALGSFGSGIGSF